MPCFDDAAPNSCCASAPVIPTHISTFGIHHSHSSGEIVRTNRQTDRPRIQLIQLSKAAQCFFNLCSALNVCICFALSLSLMYIQCTCIYMYTSIYTCRYVVKKHVFMRDEKEGRKEERSKQGQTYNMAKFTRTLITFCKTTVSQFVAMVRALSRKSCE